MENKLTGLLIVKFDTVQVTQKFVKREFLLQTTGETYPQKIIIQLTQENVNILDGFNEGDQIEVFINIRGREWAKPETGEIKYFNSLDAWRINRVGNQQAPTPTPPRTADDLTTKSEDEDDFPFY
jgi:hypothetical protein